MVVAVLVFTDALLMMEALIVVVVVGSDRPTTKVLSLTEVGFDVGWKSWKPVIVTASSVVMIVIIIMMVLKVQSV